MEGSGNNVSVAIGPVDEVLERMIKSGTMLPAVRLTYCEKMRQMYYATPLYVPRLAPGAIQEFKEDLAGHPPRETPPGPGPGPEYSEPIIEGPEVEQPMRLKIVLFLNPYAIEILQKAADAGCEWAIQEKQRLGL